jgi:hypothetical protein
MHNSPWFPHSVIWSISSLDKQQCHYDAVTKLGGMLLLILKTDPRQRQNDENYFAFGSSFFIPSVFLTLGS